MYKDISREFFIILSGRIGIFIPRPESLLAEELEAIDFLYKMSGLTMEKDLKRDSLARLGAKIGPGHKFHSYPSRYELISIKNQRVTYTAEYVARVCGNLRTEDVFEEPQFLLDDKVVLEHRYLRFRWESCSS